MGMLLAVLAVALMGGGAAFYFKVLRPKQQKAAAPQEDYGDELTDYDEPDGYGDEDARTERRLTNEVYRQPL